MEGTTGYPGDLPPPTPTPSPRLPPLWAAIALIVSGLVVMVVDTADLLFFVGLALLAVGLYALVGRERTHLQRE